MEVLIWMYSELQTSLSPTHRRGCKNFICMKWGKGNLICALGRGRKRVEETARFMSLIWYRISPMNESYRERCSKGKWKELQSPGGQSRGAGGPGLGPMWQIWPSKEQSLFFIELPLAHGGLQKHRVDLAAWRFARHQEAGTLAWEPGGLFIGESLLCDFKSFTVCFPYVPPFSSPMTFRSLVTPITFVDT